MSVDERHLVVLIGNSRNSNQEKNVSPIKSHEVISKAKKAKNIHNLRVYNQAI